jgi:AraC-like DNA-binding protein
MAIGVRDEWIDRVIAACEAFAAQPVARRAQSLRSLFAEFEAQLPDPKSSNENVVLRAMLVDLSLRSGHADHWAYHAEFPDAECGDDPAALAMGVWRNPPAQAKIAFRAWADAYIEQLERIHPRCRAAELRRDLDADFAQPLSIARLAKARRVTAHCLQRDFQELTGITIQAYVTDRRLDAAVRLLKETPDKVEWIATVVGWSSRKNLNRALARRRGVSPAAVRAGARVDQNRGLADFPIDCRR